MIRFRRTIPEDLPQIASWIRQDPGHEGMDGSFWILMQQGVSCFAVEDETGPLIFVRQEAHGDSTVLHLQFAPFDRKKIVAALREGYPLVAEDARQRGFKRVRFDSKSPALVRTMMELGFRAEMVAEL